MMVEDDVVIDDKRWLELVELTGGAAAICYQCGVCTAICPWGEVREGTVSIRAMMRQAQLGLLDESEELWLEPAGAAKLPVWSTRYPVIIIPMIPGIVPAVLVTPSRMSA